MSNRLLLANFQIYILLIIIVLSMQARLEFYPDIETKFDHLIVHMNEKNQVTKQLLKIFKDICDLERFYYTSLDKFANGLSKVLQGKDPLKDILIIVENLISNKADLSEKLAKSIKEDLMPRLEASINLKAQQVLKDKQNDVRNIRASMQRKIKMLFSNQSNFKKAVNDVNSLPKLMLLAEKEKALQVYRKKEDQFSDAIDSYNSSLNDYMLKYSEICEELLQLETNRKMEFRDSFMSLVVFQFDAARNLEYDLGRYMNELQKMTGKLQIQDKFVEFSEPFYEKKQNGMIRLAKISNKNYIDSVVGKKKVNESLLGEEIKISQLKASYPAGQVPSQTYHELVQTIFPILNFVHKNNHTNLLIEIVLFSKDIYLLRNNLKVTLLNSLLSHELFLSQKFWLDYEKRLLDKITREENLTSGDEKYLHRNFNNVLDRDLAMLLSVEIQPYISRVIASTCERAKLALVPNAKAETKAEESVGNRLPGFAYKYKIFQ